VEGSFREEYKIVYDYAQELLRSNPGSTVKFSVDDKDKNFQKTVCVFKGF